MKLNCIMVRQMQCLIALNSDWCLLLLVKKASFNGICPWSKRSYVHNSTAHNSSIYNDHGVFLGKAEARPTYNRKVSVLILMLFVFFNLTLSAHSIF